MHNIGKRDFLTALARYITHSVFCLFVLFSSIWLSLALWFQQPFNPLFTYFLIAAWVIFSLGILGIYFSQAWLSRSKDRLLYIIIFSCSLVWYFALPAKQDRAWDPEVERLLYAEQQGNQVTLYNVRNFDWHPDGNYTARWETRHYNLEQLTGINVITSYWMGPQIAHTLVSFDFKDQAPVVFSIEIRKERDESFSALGGFFRKFELSLVAADEKDIVYTRSNIRGEDVYFYPIDVPQSAMQALFTAYVEQANQLHQQAQWYNTLVSNCTTIVFDMAQAIAPETLPKDYRLLASGYLPEYLYDLGVLDQNKTILEWYDLAHINPRTQGFEQEKDTSSAQFSQRIRQSHQSVQATTATKTPKAKE